MRPGSAPGSFHLVSYTTKRGAAEGYFIARTNPVPNRLERTRQWMLIYGIGHVKKNV